MRNNWDHWVWSRKKVLISFVANALTGPERKLEKRPLDALNLKNLTGAVCVFEKPLNYTLSASNTLTNRSRPAPLHERAMWKRL